MKAAKSQTRLYSELWYHFWRSASPQSKATCRYCQATLSIAGGSIGNLSRHLKKKHPDIDLQIREKKPRTKFLMNEVTGIMIDISQRETTTTTATSNSTPPDAAHEEVCEFTDVGEVVVPEPAIIRNISTSEVETQTKTNSEETANSENFSSTEFEAVGINVALKLRKMDSLQRIYAESLISAVLTKGLLSKLSDKTTVSEICDL